ncbi:MAG: beta-N-acetylhexosaminidase [Myxococcaceae bacterium]
MKVASPLERDCARLFVVGFPGRTLDPDLATLVRDGVLGAVLFARNLGSAAESAELVAELKRSAGRPFLLAVDQEGGRVARLRGAPFTALPAMRELGRRGDVALARRAGRLLAYELSALGIDWDFAPVLDVDTNPDNPVIADRAFGSEPEQVAALGVALAQGLEEGGVASCAKHFPGHGDTRQDSHHTLPVLAHTLERLRQVELLPFRRYAQAGLASVMTAHVRFPALGEDLPATMSRRALSDLLRGELHFRGVCVSDDLEMKAISEHMGVEEATVEGARAGVDVFLVCEHADVQRRCLEALVRAVEAGHVPRQRLVEAHGRIDALLTRFSHPPGAHLEALGTAEHQRLAEGLSAAAVPVGDPTERSAAS